MDRIEFALELSKTLEEEKRKTSKLSKQCAEAYKKTSQYLMQKLSEDKSKITYSDTHYLIKDRYVCHSPMTCDNDEIIALCVSIQEERNKQKELKDRFSDYLANDISELLKEMVQ